MTHTNGDLTESEDEEILQQEAQVQHDETHQEAQPQHDEFHESATPQSPVEDEDTNLRQLQESGVLVYFTKTLLKRHRDMEQSLHQSHELLKHFKKNATVLESQIESAISTLSSEDVLMKHALEQAKTLALEQAQALALEQAQTKSYDSTSCQGDCHNAGSNSDSTSSKR